MGPFTTSDRDLIERAALLLFGCVSPEQSIAAVLRGLGVSPLATAAHLVPAILYRSNELEECRWGSMLDLGHLAGISERAA